MRRRRIALALALACGLCIVGAWLLRDGGAADGPPDRIGARPDHESGEVLVAPVDLASRPARPPTAASRISSAPFREAKRAATGSVAFQVITAADGRPVARAGIRRLPLDGETPASSIRTDAEGRATIEGLAFGLRRFTVAADGYAVRFPDVMLDVDRTAAAVVVRMEGVVTFAGTVVDEHGLPAAGAILRSPGAADDGAVRSDERGVFAAPVAWRDAISAELPGYLTWFGVAPSDGRIRLARERRPFRGVVRKAGLPLEGARLVLRSQMPADVGGADRVEEAASERDGRFAIGGGMPAGPVLLEVSAPGCSTLFWGRFRDLLLPADAESEPQILMIDLIAAVKGRGRVLEADGAPAANAKIYGSFSLGGVAHAFDCVADADGTFAFDRPLDASSSQWHVATTDGRSQAFENPELAASGVLLLTMAPDSYLVGDVTDAATGLPVPGARIGTFDGWMYGPGPVADAGGRWRTPRPHRDQMFVVTADGYLPEKFVAAREGPPGEARHDTALVAAVVVILEASADRVGGTLVSELLNDDVAGATTGDVEASPGGELGTLDSKFAVSLPTEVRADDTGYAKLSNVSPGRRRIVWIDRKGERTILADRVFAPGEIARF